MCNVHECATIVKEFEIGNAALAISNDNVLGMHCRCLHGVVVGLLHFIFEFRHSKLCSVWNMHLILFMFMCCFGIKTVVWRSRKLKNSIGMFCIYPTNSQARKVTPFHISDNLYSLHIDLICLRVFKYGFGWWCAMEAYLDWIRTDRIGFHGSLHTSSHGHVLVCAYVYVLIFTDRW